MPEENEKCLVGITSILKEAWNTVNSKDGKDKLHIIFSKGLLLYEIRTIN